MKVIAGNSVLSLTADSTDGNYTVDRLLDKHPSRIWRAATHEATLSIQTSGKTGGLAIFGTNALSAQVTVSDPNLCEWAAGLEWAAGMEWAARSPDSVIEKQLADYESGALWVDFTQFQSSVTIEVLLTTAVGGQVSAGVVRVGEMLSLGHLLYDIGEGLYDHSIKDDDADYYYKLDIVRTFELLAKTRTKEQFYNFMARVIRANGAVPMAWQLVDDGSMDWVVFAKVTDMPRGRHISDRYGTIGAEIREVR